MICWSTSAKAVLLALCLPILLSACALSDSKPGPPAVTPKLPHLPDHLVHSCPDPDIADDALVALVEHRQALALCRRLHGDTVAFYRDVQRHLEEGDAL